MAFVFYNKGFISRVYLLLKKLLKKMNNPSIQLLECVSCKEQSWTRAKFSPLRCIFLAFAPTRHSFTALRDMPM